MPEFYTMNPLRDTIVTQAAENAVHVLPPAWPLSATVAVNPFLGHVNETAAETAARLERVGGIRLALPRRHYAGKISAGDIVDADLIAALQASPLAGRLDLAALKAAASVEPQAAAALDTVADLVARKTGTDWPGIIADRIGAFAAGYVDEGQALWAASRRNGLYAAWRAFATHDLTPDILGLYGFGVHVAETPETPQAAIARAAALLQVDGAPDTYFHQLLLGLGGWAQMARGLQFTAEKEGRTDTTALELLAVRLVFEEALYIRNRAVIGEAWETVRQAHAAPLIPSLDTLIDTVLQQSAERAAQRKLAATLAAPAPTRRPSQRPELQAAFCIDVRSEVFRRSLESLDPGIATLGFAGFFGLGIGHRRFASDVVEPRLPVLLTPSVFTCTAVDGSNNKTEQRADQRARYTARAIRAWGRFKLAAVSSFAFVEATGPVYAAKLLRDSLGRMKGSRPDTARPRFAPDLDLATRATIAETVLKAMSLTADFARVVLIAGHGANVVNNPFASSLHCGACGGFAGDVNARLLANLLNAADVRITLIERGIAIPPDTVFLGGLHDTTTDTVTLFTDDLPTRLAPEDLLRIRHWLAEAGQLTRAERSARLPGATERHIVARSRDWSEVRPELGLAGCRAFIAAPRSRTAGRALEGQAFLHDYVWQRDDGFKILELILTAPVVVASWINLQYFGSVVAPGHYGSGNKLLHNVVGGIGVVEGNGGTLRAGLPWQSVHDGAALLHDPLRLTVAIEAPREALTDILRRHDAVRALADNGWLHLFALGDDGTLAWRYTGDLSWQAEEGASERAASAPTASADEQESRAQDREREDA
jgi:uncharacterized protein YbcC (UPF0753/DUF2309 family)